MLESFITLSCIFAVLAYITTRKLGLLDPVPRDPKARVASYASSVMSLLKNQLIHCKLEKWESGRVSYRKGASSEAIWVEDGYVHWQRGGKKESLPLGDKGQLTFELQGSELLVAIVAAEASGAEHSVELSLPLAS